MVICQNNDSDSLQILAQPYLIEFDNAECISPSFKSQSIVEFETSMSLFLKFEYSFSDVVRLEQNNYGYLDQYTINTDGVL